MKIIPPQKLWQWDINKKVYISGITDADEWQVHFATDDDCTALVLPIKHDDSGYWAYIPNQLVSEGRLLLCYLYNRVEDWAHTETMIKIPVQRRPKPAGYTLVLTDIETRGSLREDIGNLSSLTTQTQNNLVDAINEVNMKKHNDLDGRDAADVHPMSSITGLEQRLQSIDSVGTGQAKAIAQLKQDIETNEAIDTSQSKAISSMQQSISSIQSASESNAAAISDMQVSISSINDVNYTQSQAIADAQSDIMSLIDQDTVLSQDIAALANADTVLTQAINSLSGSVDSAFAEVEAALDKKQPVGSYITSVNGTTPDKNGNINIDVQTYTAGDGISINEGAISVKNPMDDEQVSETTTWSSAKIISSVSQPFSQSGSIITCQPVEGSPLHVVSDITAVQEGEGDPSPDNVRPIVGYSSANLVRCGTNLIGGALEPYPVSNNAGLRYGYATEYVPSGNYQWNAKLVNANDYQKFIYIRIIYIDNTLSDYNYITTENNEVHTIGNFVLNQKGQIVLFPAASADGSSENKAKEALDKINVQISPTAQSQNYEPYRGQTYTADFGETVYGGTLDWSTGVLTVDRKSITFDGSEDWDIYQTDLINGVLKPVTYSLTDSDIGYNTSICSRFKNVERAFASNELWIYSDHNNLVNKYFNVPIEQIPDLDAWKTYLSTQKSAGTPVQLVYQLQAPYTIQLTPAQILAISGTNTVYCDTGDVTVTGYEDPRHTVAQLTSRIAALESAATGI